MIVLKIILWIVGISALVGIAAMIQDIIKPTGAHKPYGPYERFIKRGVDTFLSTGALIVLSPIWIITALLVRIKLGSPVLFAQDRPGLSERVFRLHKFRSMTNKKDEAGNLLPDEERLPAFGKKLRSTSLDELPELLNIIKGDMAIVGPRPLLPQYLPYYTARQRHRHDVRPGLTGYAQAHGRNAIDWDERLEMDVAYVDHITFKNDIQIIIDTLKVVFRHEGISSATSATMESFIDYSIAKGRTANVGSKV